DLERLRERGHEIGSHTRRHRDLAGLSDAELGDEIAGSHQDLVGRLGDTPHFAWPYGRFKYFSAQAARTVYQARFRSCASAERGAHRPERRAEPEEICIRREHIVAGWPLSHQLYFIAKSAGGASPTGWPQGWTRG